MNLLRIDGHRDTIGVRPEDMRLASDGLAAVVESVEYLGADSLLAARAGAQAMLVRVPGRAPAQAGDAVHVAWDGSHEHRFDPQTGGRRP
jgi:sn-glycerol 3-phosphate transport system ATP-binding protein